MARNRKRAKERRARSGSDSSLVTTSRSEVDYTPDPISHATPDVELAEAQLAVGRPELADGPVDLEEEPEVDSALGAGGAGARARSRGDGASGTAVAQAPRVGTGTRLVNFLQGSWRELQRVQWPDRRQVIQATGVVVGFVIVAGVYLALADGAASKLMSYILYGHF